MSLHEDRRGRVPFALVGVLLLVGASVYATGLADRAEPSIEQPATAAMDDVERDTRPALRAAVRDAARESAREPVTEPADTPAGQALNTTSPFVDALRLRIAAGARQALSEVSREQDGVRATASLPLVNGSTASLRRAKHGIQVRPVDDGASMLVTVRNVTVRARADGRVLSQRRLNVTLTVDAPVLALHQRTEQYESRLNRGALAGPGLSRGLTGRLTALTMARGYGRYAGAPIQNVLGNRHVELSTNAALLAQQRAAFGRADPDGARAVDVATVRVGVLDVLGGRHDGAAGWTKTVLDPSAVGDRTEADGFDPQPPDRPPITAAPDAVADEAYLDATEGPGTAGSYRVRSHLRATVVSRSSGTRPAPRLENWTLLTERIDQRTTVKVIEQDSNRAESAAVDARRKVIVRHTVERTWYRNGSFQTTTTEWTETARVAVRVNVAYDPDDTAPDRPTEPLFERGGALDGPNLASARERAATELLDANGGVDGVAVAAAERRDGALTRERTSVAARPDGLDAWVLADLRELRASVANVSVTVPSREVAAGEANAPALLAAAVRERRAALVDAPATYDGAADRARVAARAAYVDRVIAALESRAADTRDRNGDYRTELSGGATGQLSRLIELGRETAGADDPYQRDRESGEELVVTPDGSPAYLTLSSVGHQRVPTVAPGESVHPLTARTTNWVAMPYGDAADGVADALLGGGKRRVSLETAAATLIAANRTAATAGTANGSAAELAANRAELTAAVRRSVRNAEREVCAAVTDGTGNDRRTCRDAVVDVRSEWPTLGHRAQAMGNGSYAAAFGDALAARGVGAAAADEATVRVRVRLRELDAKRETGVPAAMTNQTASAVQQVARKVVKKQSKAVIRNESERAMRRLTGASRLPAGVPVAPPPYPWIASVNAWSVTVRGEYQRFVVRARGPAPDGGGGVLRYVRDGSSVAFDADGDGQAERLGRNDHVSFEASTTVVAVVPPGPPGIGDVDGNRDERSPGWPCPGDEETDRCTRGEQPE
ncbi:DUF7286 family protein [Halolamina salifodinae]|uniref:Uncharacterized protein n=1 Tax=Halolamina salifodinae TaxID=1202767 RepID=A0A8T4GRB2_9EURY|nr:hypothetical protein [Halolamina salifodinae]MBP1985587.1 hypothetical protein [Halolamina salifodinae]